MDDEFVATIEYENDGFKHPRPGVESQPQLTPWWAVAEWLDMLRPCRGVKGVFVTDAVIPRGWTNSHTTCCARAARIVSDRVA